MSATRQELLEGAKLLEHNHLAEGEVTGHFHAAEGAGVQLFEKGGTMLLDAPNGAEITHQEHNAFAVPPGLYERRQVREYDHLDKEVRPVFD